MINATKNLNELRHRMISIIYHGVLYAASPLMSLDVDSTDYQNNLNRFIPEIKDFKNNLETQIQSAATDYQSLIQNKETHFQEYTEKITTLEALMKQQEELQLKCQFTETDIHNHHRRIRDNLNQAREFDKESEKIRQKLALTAPVYIFAPNQLKKEVGAMNQYKDAARRLFESERDIEREIDKCHHDLHDMEEDIQKIKVQINLIQEAIHTQFSDIEACHLKISDQLHYLGYLENLIACIQNHIFGSNSDQEILELLKQDPEKHHYAPSKMIELIKVWNEHHDDRAFHDYIMQLANL